MMARSRLTRSGARAGAGLLVVLWMEQMWAAYHDFPSFPDLDPSGEFGDPGKPLRRIILLGDSTITAPGLTNPDDIWIRQMVPALTASYYIHIDSVAVGGARLANVSGDQIGALSRSYDVAFVSAGSNDALRGMTQFQMREALSTICLKLLDRATVVVLAGAGDIGTAPRLPYPLCAIATARAKSTDAAHAAVAAESERIFHVPMWELTTPIYRTEKQLFSADRFHPNRRGHQIWAEAALPTLMEALSKVT